jgi:hypothetical protein
VEAERAGAPRLDEQGGEPLDERTVGDAGAQGERVDVRTKGAAADTGAEERRVGPPCDLVEALVEHPGKQLPDELAPVVAFELLSLAGMLPQELDARPRDLRIGGDARQQIVVQRDGGIRWRRRRGPR